MGIKLAIVGSREFNDFLKLQTLIDKFLKENDYSIDVIISGGCRGTDKLATRYGKENNIEIKEFIPEWQKYGKQAGYIRNREIVNACDFCIAFWSGSKKGGTANDIKLCRQLNKPCWIYNFITDSFYRDC